MSESKFHIDTGTRFLIEVDSEGLEWVHTDCAIRNSKRLQQAYTTCAEAKWGHEVKAPSELGK
jgi:hypothetical protein